MICTGDGGHLKPPQCMEPTATPMHPPVLRLSSGVLRNLFGPRLGLGQPTQEGTPGPRKGAH